MARGTGQLRLRFELRDIDPPIWREVLVAPHTTLGELHRVIQLSMGWLDYHLYLFRCNGEEYEPLDPDEGDDPDDEDPVDIELSTLLTEEGDTLDYEYDFGDGWEILVQLIERRPESQQHGAPRCLRGSRQGPPEDSGGPFGYDELLEILADPHHPEHDSMREWIPVGFDPEEFDKELINRGLQREFGR
jgi:hypothetical protein